MWSETGYLAFDFTFIRLKIIFHKISLEFENGKERKILVWKTLKFYSLRLIRVELFKFQTYKVSVFTVFVRSFLSLFEHTLAGGKNEPLSGYC